MKAVLFDMDGVLADTEGFYNRRRAAYLAEVLPEYDGPWDFAGSNDKAIWETIVPDDSVLRERLHAGYDAYRAEHPEDYRTLGNSDAPAVFAQIKEAGLLVGIASSSEVPMIERMMRETGLIDLVDAYTSGHDVAHHKPAPDVYLACMERLGVRPRECVVVEDSPTGIEAGLAAGAYVVALAQYVAPGTDQSAADLCISRLAELPRELGLPS
jgi:beta-phosphoglucomutase-like phosphatase (HAD superfamily)